MFVETVTSTRELWEAISEGTRIVTEPPEALKLPAGKLS